MIAYTDSSAAAVVGAASSHQVDPKTNETMNVHVYGKLYTNLMWVWRILPRYTLFP